MEQSISHGFHSEVLVSISRQIIEQAMASIAMMLVYWRVSMEID